MKKRKWRSWRNGSPKLVTITSSHSFSLYDIIKQCNLCPCMLILIYVFACHSDSILVVSKGTLIICPASLVHHWKREIDRHVKTAKLTVCLYHGPNRERSAKVWEDHAHTQTYTPLSLLLKAQSHPVFFGLSQEQLKASCVVDLYLPYLHLCRIPARDLK